MTKKCTWNKSKKIKSIGILNLKEKIGFNSSLFYKNHKRKIKIIGVTELLGRLVTSFFS